MAITASSLVEACADKLGAYYTSIDSDTYDMDYWEYSDWVTYISDAYKHIVSDTGWLLGNVTVTLQAETTNSYNFPDNVAEVTNIVYDPTDDAVALKVVSPDYMMAYHGPAWEEQTGTPYLAVIRDAVSAGIYTKEIILFPDPEEEKTILVEYVPSQSISSLDDSLQIPDDFAEAIRHKILSYAYEKSGSERDLSLSQFNHNMYMSKLNELDVDIKTGTKNIGMPRADFL